MNILFWVLVGFILNLVIGAGVCAALDTEDEVFYKWYKDAPFSILRKLILTFWPVMAWYMVQYKNDRKR